MSVVNVNKAPEAWQACACGVYNVPIIGVLRIEKAGLDLPRAEFDALLTRETRRFQRAMLAFYDDQQTTGEPPSVPKV